MISIIIVLGLDLLIKLQVIKGYDAHLPLLFPKLDCQKVHCLSKPPVSFHYLLLLLFVELLRILATRIDKQF